MAIVAIQYQQPMRTNCVSLCMLIIIIHCLTSDSDPYWAHADYSLYTCGEKTLLRKPCDLSPRLLGLAYKAPTSHLWCSTTLLFDLFGNHCCRNKPTDALVSQTLLYYCRVIRGRLLLAPLSSITIFFVTRNWSSTFQLISHQVTALRPFYIKSSVLQFSMPATKSIASWLVRRGHNSITYFSVCLGQLHLHLRLPTRTPTQQSQSFSPIIPVLKSVAIVFSAFVRPSWSS